MIITVHVKPKSKRPAVTEVGENELVVAVSAAPTGGKANEAVMKAIAEYFEMPRSRVRMVRGLKSRVKRVEIDRSISHRIFARHPRTKNHPDQSSG